MSKRFEILEEDGIVRMKVTGGTPEELFSHALAGMASFLKAETIYLKKSELKEWQKIRVESLDMTSLLIEFLSKVLGESDSKGVVYSVASFDKFGENFLEGKIFGVKSSSIEKEINAVSFEDVDIKRNQETGFLETTLTFEI